MFVCGVYGDLFDLEFKLFLILQIVCRMYNSFVADWQHCESVQFSVNI